MTIEGFPLVQQARHQTTIINNATVSGFGFWSGLDVTVEFQPADVDAGVVFVRRDLPGQPRIPARIQNRVSGPRRTTLVHRGCAVEMVEHVMAALAGLNIDNVEVHVDRAEMPGMDGSSLPFVEALLSAGQIIQDATKPTLSVYSPVVVDNENSRILAVPTTQSNLNLEYELDYPHTSAIDSQTFCSAIDRESFIYQIAPARTFLLASEADSLRKRGLGQRVTNQDVLVFDDHGLRDNKLRFSDELARHKTLDMIGDFALAGRDLIGRFTATRSGHALNSKMVFALMQQFEISKTLRQSA